MRRGEQPPHSRGDGQAEYKDLDHLPHHFQAFKTKHCASHTPVHDSTYLGVPATTLFACFDVPPQISHGSPSQRCPTRHQASGIRHQASGFRLDHRLSGFRLGPPGLRPLPFDVGCSDVPMFDVPPQISHGSPSQRCPTRHRHEASGWEFDVPPQISHGSPSQRCPTRHQASGFRLGPGASSLRPPASKRGHARRCPLLKRRVPRWSHAHPG